MITLLDLYRYVALYWNHENKNKNGLTMILCKTKTPIKIWIRLSLKGIGSVALPFPSKRKGISAFAMFPALHRSIYDGAIKILKTLFKTCSRRYTLERFHQRFFLFFFFCLVFPKKFFEILFSNSVCKNLENKIENCDKKPRNGRTKDRIVKQAKQQTTVRNNKVTRYICTAVSSKVVLLTADRQNEES